MTHDPLVRFRNDLLAIADAYALLAGRDRESLRDERTAPDHDRRHREYLDDDTSTVVYGQATGTTVPADPIAHLLPTGPTKERRNGPVVGGSTEAKVPISLDDVDLLAPANAGSVTVSETTPWPKDQVGHIAVSSELDFHVRDMANTLGDPLPMPTAPVLAMWLHERADWAWDHYWAIDRLAVDASRIARTLHAMVNPGRPRSEQKAAPCPGCGEATLQGDGERVWCDMEDCGRILTEVEYVVWSREVIVRETLGGPGISAAAIAIKYQRTKDSVHWLAHKHHWAKSDGKQRPVLYLIADVEVTMATIHDRATRRTARLDTA